jgi:hypothetical protein
MSHDMAQDFHSVKRRAPGVGSAVQNAIRGRAGNMTLLFALWAKAELLVVIWCFERNRILICPYPR